MLIRTTVSNKKGFIFLNNNVFNIAGKVKNEIPCNDLNF